MTVLLRGTIVFLGVACLIVALAELYLHRHSRAGMFRWAGRALLVVYVVVGNLRALHLHRPVIWISYLPVAALAFLLIGYSDRHTD